MDLKVYPDHHPYTADDNQELTRWSREIGANFVLTTQKDLVKLRVSTLGALPLRALRIGLEITEGGEALEALLASLLNRVDAANGMGPDHAEP